jgi:pyridinium-3,5-bisthiocarboxylic acid mononucleotide nickel chelatase
MKTLYLECKMGAAGDMLMGALLELVPNPEQALEQLNDLGIPGVTYAMEKTAKCGILGTHVTVTVNGQEEHSHDHGHEHHDHEHEHEHHRHDHDHEHHHHHHTSMADITHIMSHLPLPETVRNNALGVYQAIAQAESKAHGMPVEEIHFHEVGAMDAVADVVGVCMLMDQLKVDQVCASPVHVGSGHVHCAHGILPVPAPATADLLRGIPSYGGEIQGELCTPTGAALLRQFVTKFGPMPQMAVEKIGYGMGSKDFPMANCVRAMLGQTEDTPGDQVVELQCNLDDMTPEDIGFAVETLLENGALDVYTTAIQMKKNRPGVLLSVLCHPEQRENMVGLLFRHTTTLGIRETEHRRYTLERSSRQAETPWGTVEVKQAQGWDVTREKPEFDRLREIAKKENLSMAEVRKALK